RPAKFDWLTTLGYPITEPYWIDVRINGKTNTALVQLFDRRALTYNPTNPPASQVEMGNVGRHYYLWRYANTHAADFKAAYEVQITVGPAPTRSTHVEEKVELTNSTGEALDRV